MSRATKLDFSDREVEDFLEQTGLKKLEGKGVLAIVDNILGKRAERSRRDKENDRWLSEGNY